jgi:succinate dehydrogenase/fumarate reductase flavoprotein subunit
MTSPTYDLVVVGSGFAGCMTTLNFLETCKRLNKRGHVAMLEAGKKGERCGASRWTGAFLRMDKDLRFDEDWIKEMMRVSNGQADAAYCEKLAMHAQETAEYVRNRGVNLVRHKEENVSCPPFVAVTQLMNV